jgi:GOST, seven transmembrane domain
MLAKGQKTTDTVSLVVPDRAWYRLIQLNCNKGHYVARLDYVAVNPGGEYLSLAQVPFKSLFVYLIIVWATLTAAWSMLWFRYRHFNVRLHQLLTILPIGYVLYSAIMLRYWQQASSTGHWPTSLYWMGFFASGVLKMFTFIGLFLLAKGWCIMRQTISTVDVKRILTIAVSLGVSYWLFAYFGGIPLFMLIMMYVLSLRFIFAMVAMNASKLIGQLEILQAANIDAVSTQAYQRLFMYKRFQGTVMVYISVDVIFNLWASVFLQAYPWAEEMIDHGIALFLCGSISSIFGLKPFNPFYFLHLGLPDDNYMQQGDGVIDEENIQHPAGAAIIPYVRAGVSAPTYRWEPGQPVPDMTGVNNFNAAETPPYALVEMPFGDENSARLMIGQPTYQGHLMHPYLLPPPPVPVDAPPGIAGANGNDAGQANQYVALDSLSSPVRPPVNAVDSDWKANASSIPIRESVQLTPINGRYELVPRADEDSKFSGTSDDETVL